MNIQYNKISVLDKVVEIEATQLVENGGEQYSTDLSVSSKRPPLDEFRDAMSTLIPHLMILGDETKKDDPEEITEDEMSAYVIKSINLKHTKVGYNVIIGGGKNLKNGKYMNLVLPKEGIQDEDSSYEHWKALDECISVIIHQANEFMKGRSSVKQLDMFEMDSLEANLKPAPDAEPEKVDAEVVP